MSSSEGTKDRTSDGAQDGKVDWLRARLLNRQGGATVAKMPAKRLCGAACSPADWIRAGRGRSRGGSARLVGPGVVWES